MTNCLDAETIAAWMDGSLSERERAAAEAHAADCERCLAVLATMARTAPPPQEAVRPSWFSVRWLVPVATAAVAVVAWILVQNPAQPVRPVDTVAAPASESAPAADAPAQIKQEPTPQANARGVAAERKPAPTDIAETRKSVESARRGKQSQSAEEVARREQLDRLSRDGLVAAPKSAAAPPPPRPATEPPPVTAASPQAAAAAAAGRAMNETVLQQQFRSAVEPTIVVSPDPKLRWRIAGNFVERSTDGGVTWTVQMTGVKVALSSGASPAPGVCWIVGRGGTVLLTTDGETWRPIEFPDQTAHLVSVSARDALSATVTTSDGRTYRTGDGGKTWRVQENPAAAF